jgi:site-specific DNA-methyltransferase (adenine-specific)
VGNNHPTVKPVELMKYLVRLVTPENGKVLDPFNGSGSTGMACVELGYEYVGCELDQTYVDIATKRIEGWIKHIETKKTAHLADNNFNELFE